MLNNLRDLTSSGLAQTKRLIKEGGLAIHPAVAKASLEGSRGLQNNCRLDSDLDLSLILAPEVEPTVELCEQVIEYSQSRWQSEVELDLAVVFDKHGCGLKCFEVSQYDPDLCSRGVDCLGVYKNQKGFSGFLEGLGLEVRHMYPVLIIWRR